MPQADRFNTGKAPLSMVLEARHAMAGVAGVLAFGAQKYSRGNWRQGMPVSVLADSLARHLTAYLSGETCDPESGLPHVDHILCNALFLSEIAKTHPEYDDRVVRDTAPPTD